MNPTRLPVSSIHLWIRHPFEESFLTGASTKDLFREAQAVRDLWARDIPGADLRELTMEVTWEDGASFTADIPLIHPSQPQALEECYLAAHLVHYLEYSTGERETWAPTVTMLERLERADPGVLARSPWEVAKGMDFRNETKRTWAQGLLDGYELPEVA